MWRGGPAWAAEELALLGTADDEGIAQRIGRTVGAVRHKRQALRIKAFRDRRTRRRRRVRSEVSDVVV